ncbi:GlxA family transcriptional regulator [Actinacidiphila bryophytorum]|uniref:Transcriptional regulator, AraC family with amidase-like domain n=1 Tax=Actinacidiphila bryophytorum TaxID=1436133 RepID=A0A9W4E8Q5_9ACTN|nr:GlxA family transcriptional regulator [Actinacidiphila bryophytorum]MBM9439347.1 GlxA family transcriptional regulator [Actinacidiphila bryophytorum]MBN6545782.1 GlxA family transcriptional regulator [Actinacidiphila bryophytorum]CAG7618706.1 Transcriptional regulator, AraC family with amidase-like domain [Actinacidiphila bryophytorum]
MTSRRIVFAVFPGFQLLDLAGPNEVFVQAGRLAAGAAGAAGQGVAVDTVAAAPGPVASSGGITVTPTLTAGEVTGPVDTLVAVGGRGVHQACQDAEFVDWFARTSRRARRTASVCSGAFLLGAAGLLEGRRVVTHWSACDLLAQRHPAAAVDPDPIFVRDGDLWTSAGVTAGIDLALAMVEADDGPEVARAVARQLVMFVQRPGGQAQFSAQLAARRPERQPLRDVLDWVADHLADDLGVPALAARAGMSERHFTRVFRAETGRTPAAFVESARVEAARRLLESTGTTVEAVARACGYGTRETLQRSFKRAVQVTPGEYRRRFAPHSAAG